MRRPDRARTTKNFKRQLEISLISSPFQSKTTTPDISQSTGAIHIHSDNINRNGGIKYPEAWMLATTDRQGHKSAKQRGNAPDYTPDS